MFIYGGGLLNLESNFHQQANQIDKENLKMNILVYDNNYTIIKQNEKIIK